ncbi:tungsten ABC transporter substrate-binding protein [Candidatus Magnetomorum sp. HK-1]|nr:tungsten ABC transporter substrate-binding protein [Candidatus Magnetomorum sp. HK-1]
MKTITKQVKWFFKGLILGTCFVCIAQSVNAESTTLMMATTTSTDNTGLLDYLAPHVLKSTGIELKWIAVGTGKALKMGQNCDVDILMVHAPPAEQKFVDSGFGVKRMEIMYNDFIIMGPTGDPAKIKGLSIKKAFEKIRNKQQIFISRGDNSGTHKKEKSLWKEANMPVPDRESWYVQTGQGMLASIRIATERKGYIMADRGTYIKFANNFKGKPPLICQVEGDTCLKNQYSVICVNPKNCPSVNFKTAQKLAKWLTGNDAQQLIGNFKLLGKTLFIPNAQ